MLSSQMQVLDIFQTLRVKRRRITIMLNRISLEKDQFMCNSRQTLLNTNLASKCKTCWKVGESQDCPPQDWPHGGQSWGGQSWALSVIRIAHLNYNTIFSLPAWFRVVTIDSGCFDMISTYLIQSASMFNWFIIRFIMDTQIHKKVQLNIFTHWVICLSSIQLWKGKWAGRGLLYKYIFSSVHTA